MRSICIAAFNIPVATRVVPGFRWRHASGGFGHRGKSLGGGLPRSRGRTDCQSVPRDVLSRTDCQSVPRDVLSRTDCQPVLRGVKETSTMPALSSELRRQLENIVIE